MSDILVRDIDPALKRKLKASARAHDRSLSEEVKALVRRGLEAQQESPQAAAADLGAQIRALLTELGLDGVELDIPPRQSARNPPDFR